MNKLVLLSWLYRYDAVTVNGDLGWQDKLNKYNKPFFDLCDGIFVNYTWKVNLLSFAGSPQSRLNDDLKILE
jgi:endo-beta-N-acetylglucosaminidase D